MPQSCASTEEKGNRGEGRSGKNCRQGLPSALSFMGTWAAGSAKTALILEAEEKNISIQKQIRHIAQVIEMSLKGEKKMFNVFGFQSKPQKCDPLTLAKWKSQIHYLGTQGKSMWAQLLRLMPRLLEKQLHSVDIW